jgi:hypothetical protein
MSDLDAPRHDYRERPMRDLLAARNDQYATYD